VSGYNFLIPNLSRQQMPYIVLPVMDALQALGHTPVTIDMASINDMYSQMRYQRHGCYEIFKFYAEDIFKKGKIDFGFSAGMFIVLEDQGKKESHHLLDEAGIPNIIYLHVRDHSIITRLEELGAKNWQVTYLACCSQQLAEMLAQAGFPNAVYVPPGTNARIYFPAADAPENVPYPLKLQDERLATGYQVSFAGSYGIKREELLTALVEAGFELVIFGPREWKQSSLMRHYRGDAAYLTELNTVFNHSRINLDLPHDGTRLDDYFSFRVYDCLAAKGFIATHQRPGLEAFFDPGREIAVYNDAEGLVKAVQYYLDNEDERLAIARRGYQRVAREGGWQHRLDRLIPQLEMRLLTTAV